MSEVIKDYNRMTDIKYSDIRVGDIVIVKEVKSENKKFFTLKEGKAYKVEEISNHRDCMCRGCLHGGINIYVYNNENDDDDMSPTCSVTLANKNGIEYKKG